MSYDLIIKGGTVTTACDQYEADVAVSKGRIVAIAQDIPVNGTKAVDAKGLLVMPGGIDVHTHLDMPFMGATTADDFTTGTTAAVCGGTTCIIDFAIQKKGGTLRGALDEWHEKADGKCAVDYGFHMIVADLPENAVKEMDKIVDEGVPSFKLFLAYPGVFMSDDATIFRALMRTKENGGMVSMHAENGQVIDILVKQAVADGRAEPKWHPVTRPIAAEAEATRRAIALAEMAGAPMYIVHLTCAAALDEVRRARERGLSVCAETCPQYLYLSQEDYERPGFEGAKFVMSPPLRPKENQEALWQGLANNSLQIVSTDHCSFNMKAAGGKIGKELGKKDFSKIPNGAPGIETRMVLMWDGVAKGRLSANRFVDITATTPAKMFGLYPRKGTIAPGADADILLLDPNKKSTISAKTHHMNVDYSPYEGMTVACSVQDVFVRGEQMVKAGKFVDKHSHGKFQRRAPRVS